MLHCVQVGLAVEVYGTVVQTADLLQFDGLTAFMARGHNAKRCRGTAAKLDTHKAPPRACYVRLALALS